MREISESIGLIDILSAGFMVVIYVSQVVMHMDWLSQQLISLSFGIV